MEEIASSWARDCQRCAFYVAVRDGVERPPATLGGCVIVDIADDDIKDDPKSYNRNSAKLQSVFFHGLPHQSHDWACFVDSDVHFIMPNFRRLVVRENLNPAHIHWTGYTYMHTLLEEGITVEPFGGSCTSRAASEQFRKLFHGWDSETSAMRRNSRWPPDKYPCERIPIPHPPGLVLSYVTVCLRRAGIFPPDPETMYDKRGRVLYCNFGPLTENLLESDAIRPPLFPIALLARPEYNHTVFDWKHKEYIYTKCRNHRWVGYYPVMFHGHVTHTPGYLQTFEGGTKMKVERKRKQREAPSHKQVYLLLAKNKFLLPDDFHEDFREVLTASRGT